MGNIHLKIIGITIPRMAGVVEEEEEEEGVHINNNISNTIRHNLK
jgi:hypothetical protein